MSGSRTGAEQHWCPDVDALELDAGEPLGSDADDRHRSPIEDHRTTNGVQVTAELSLPETVADDDDGLRRVHILFLGNEEATGDDTRPEQREEVRRRRRGRDESGRSAVSQDGKARGA